MNVRAYSLIIHLKKNTETKISRTHQTYSIDENVLCFHFLLLSHFEILLCALLCIYRLQYDCSGQSVEQSSSQKESINGGETDGRQKTRERNEDKEKANESQRGGGGGEG